MPKKPHFWENQQNRIHYGYVDYPPPVSIVKIENNETIGNFNNKIMSNKKKTTIIYVDESGDITPEQTKAIKKRVTKKDSDSILFTPRCHFDASFNLDLSAEMPLITDFMKKSMESIASDLAAKKEAIIRDRFAKLGVDIETIIKNKNKLGYLRISNVGGSETYFYKESRIVTFYTVYKNMSNPLRNHVGFETFYY